MIAFGRATLDVLFAGVWQGACIAIVVTAGLALAGRRLNATTRCVVLQIALAAVTIVPIAATVPGVVSATAHVGGYAVREGAAAQGELSHRASFETSSRRVDVVLGDRGVLAILVFWLCGACALLARIGVGLLLLRRLVRESDRLTDREGVRVFASTTAGVPLALGFVSPSILVPSVFASVQEEFECVFLHELAHVRRRDVWANAVERIVQAFLYFNPAVLLLLRSIALERESACDDWAVARTPDVSSYTHSLASFALHRAPSKISAACGAAGFGRATLTRIRRLEDGRRNGAVALSHYALGGSLVMMFVVAFTLSLAPAVAFAPAVPASAIALSATACKASPTLIVNATEPKRPGNAGPGLVTLVRVTVAADGKVLGATVYKKSGNAIFDQDVLTAAKTSIYAAPKKNCRPVGGSYVFKAQTG